VIGMAVLPFARGQRVKTDPVSKLDAALMTVRPVVVRFSKALLPESLARVQFVKVPRAK
jgi:hypothetical protein